MAIDPNEQNQEEVVKSPEEVIVDQQQEVSEDNSQQEVANTTNATETTQETPRETAPQVDPEEVAAKVKKEFETKILDAMGISKEEKKQAVEEGYQTPWEKRGEKKPASWQEAIEAGADYADWKRTQQEKEIAKVQEAQEQEAKEVNKKWDDYWESELNDLVKTGKIPAVQDQKDPNDAGRKARIKLFGKLSELAKKSQAEGTAPVTSLKLVFYEHYESDEPSGADAPVSFGKKGVNSGEKGEYSYDDIRDRSFDQIKRGK